jgi:hypothetical protein
MAVGPIGSSFSTGLAGLADRFAGKPVSSAAEAAKVSREKTTIADHVAALDEQEPIRSASTTLGTLLDTYL